MYCITDEQIDYILNDIRRRGVDTEDLQLNLLDHICCIVEQDLGDGEDFEHFYLQTISRFYNGELKEIETETQLLLTFKNYYAMRKILMGSGALSVLAFITGSFLKLMHLPGAALMIFGGALLICFLVLPLMILLKTRESVSMREKLVFALGCITGILYCTSTMFALLRWPGGTILWISTMCVSMFLFIPMYFFTGIRKPELRSNTMLTSVLLVCATCMLFAMVALKQPRPANTTAKSTNTTSAAFVAR